MLSFHPMLYLLSELRQSYVKELVCMFKVEIQNVLSRGKLTKELLAHCTRISYFPLKNLSSTKRTPKSRRQPELLFTKPKVGN